MPFSRITSARTIIATNGCYAVARAVPCNRRAGSAIELVLGGSAAVSWERTWIVTIAWRRVLMLSSDRVQSGPLATMTIHTLGASGRLAL